MGPGAYVCHGTSLSAAGQGACHPSLLHGVHMLSASAPDLVGLTDSPLSAPWRPVPLSKPFVDESFGASWPL